MEIKTKFNIGQEVFMLCENVVHKVEIEEIGIQVAQQITVITCYLKEHPISKTYDHRVCEKELHATKQDLLDSL